jgi:uncharacterized protein YhaN
MKIKSLGTSSFGKFNTRKEWSNLSPNINVFYGPNEAGKSTVFNMITDTLFGFTSLSKEKNKHVNDSTGMLNLSSEIEFKDGVTSVKREIDGKNNLELIKNGRHHLLKNDSLNEVEHVSRMTYKDVYSVDLNHLVEFSNSTWTQIEEVLLKLYSGDSFRSPAQVLKQVELDKNVIKRQSERGNSKIKSLEEERRELFKIKREYQKNLETVSVYKEELSALNRRIDEKSLLKVNKVKRLENTKLYLPLMKAYKELSVLDKKLSDVKGFEDLDQKTYKQHKEGLKKAYLKMDELSDKVSKYVMEKRRLQEWLEHEPIKEAELNEMHQKYLQLQTTNKDLDDLASELNEGYKQLKKTFENTFDETFDDRHIEEVLNINYLNLKSLIGEIEEIYEEIKILKRNKRLSNGNRSNSIIGLMVVLVGISSGLVYINYHELLNYAAMAIIGLGLSTIVYQLSKRKKEAVNEEELLEEKEDLRQQLISELNGIRLSSIVEEYIGQEFLNQVIELKQLTESYKKLKDQYDRKSLFSEELSSDLEAYLTRFDALDDKSPFDDLFTRAQDVQKKQSRIQVINAQLDVLNENLSENEKGLNDLERYISESDDFLRRYGDGNIHNGLEKLGMKHKWMVRRETLQNDIDKTVFDEQNLKKFIEEYKSREGDYFNEQLIEVELENLKKELQELIVQQVSLSKDIEVFESQTELQAVESRLLAIDEEILNYKSKYDHLLVLEHVIKTCDEKYRRENQPSVFAKASDYLSIITEGLYNDLEVVENDKKTQMIYVRHEGEKVLVNEKFSMGTLNQIYFSLRLSLIDHLDYNKEQLPLCFDELLVNWDEKRLMKTLKIIEQVSTKRQVMIFTCHDWFVEHVKKMNGVKVFNL